MCGRFVQVWDEDLQRYVALFVAARISEGLVSAFAQEAPRGYNVAPTRTVGILLPHEQEPGDGVAVLSRARWGFPLPGAAKDVANTRIEGAYDSPMWRALIGRSHAIVPVQGFYEWSQTPDGKQPHYIHRRDGRPLLLAAVAGERRVNGELSPCVSLITCAPNEHMRAIHDRMPVILEEDTARAWLRPGGLPPEDVARLCVPAGEVLASHEVETTVGNSTNHGAHLIKPRVPSAGGRQTRLF